MRSSHPLALVISLALPLALPLASSAQPAVHDARYELAPVLHVVTERPPEPRIVVRPAIPFQHAVWVAGYWDWDVNHWVWRDGHWTQPRPGMTWIDTRWEPRGDGWVRIPGRWQ